VEWRCAWGNVKCIDICVRLKMGSVDGNRAGGKGKWGIDMEERNMGRQGMGTGRKWVICV